MSRETQLPVSYFYCCYALATRYGQKRYGSVSSMELTIMHNLKDFTETVSKKITLSFFDIASLIMIITIYTETNFFIKWHVNNFYCLHCMLFITWTKQTIITLQKYHIDNPKHSTLWFSTIRTVLCMMMYDLRVGINLKHSQGRRVALENRNMERIKSKKRLTHNVHRGNGVKLF